MAATRSEEHTSELQSLPPHHSPPIYSAKTSLAKHLDPPCWTSDNESLPEQYPRERSWLEWPPLDRKSTRLNSSHFPHTTLLRSTLRKLLSRNTLTHLAGRVIMKVSPNSTREKGPG